MNSAASAVTAGREYPFSDADFSMLSDLARQKFGLHLQPSKKALVYSRLAKRLRALDLPNFKSYCALLRAPDGLAEEPNLLSALTTNVTHFFRERHHFDFLRDQILPTLIERARSGQSIRLWSSACSAGQEAYCLAAVLLNANADVERYNIRILATDIDPKIVAKAKTGRYPADQLTAIPDEYRAIMIDRSSSDDTSFSMDAKLRELISFGQLNLIGDWPMQRKFDVILCRNVAIYFDKNTQSRLWDRFANALQPTGHLMIGHSERLCGPAEARFRNVGVTTYRKATSNSAAAPLRRDPE